jgi:hypothetical protein
VERSSSQLGLPYSFAGWTSWAAQGVAMLSDFGNIGLILDQSPFFSQAANERLLPHSLAPLPIKVHSQNSPY